MFILFASDLSDGSNPFEICWDPQTGRVQIPGRLGDEVEFQGIIDDPPETLFIPSSVPGCSVHWGRNPGHDPYDFLAAVESIFGGDRIRWTLPSDMKTIRLRRSYAALEDDPPGRTVR